MTKKALTVTAEEGLHARPASLLTNLCQKFKSDIKLEKDGQTIDPKSILGVMMLAAKKDDVVTVIAEGEDEEQAIQAIDNLFAQGFKE